MGLEKVDALIDSLSRSREKANVLDYEIAEEKGLEIGREREERQESREIGRERVLEREMGM